MRAVYLNAIATAVPDFDVHAKFVSFCPRLLRDPRAKSVFQRMARRAQIEHRYSFLEPHPDEDKLDVHGFYRLGQFPDTAARMAFYERYAMTLAERALNQLDLTGITHLVTTTCTGFYSPGIDHQLIKQFRLSPAIERTSVGFMGCYAAVNALKLARHIVRSDHHARVLVLNLELCTLHLQAEASLEDILSFLIFSDGCAASVVSAKPTGLELEGFQATVIPNTEELINWRIGSSGFDMKLSGQVPAAIEASLPEQLKTLLGERTQADITHWAIHPGGRTVLDAVRAGAQLEEHRLTTSREVLRRFGNMSSATIMFVLADIMKHGNPGLGCAMAFGPGLTVERLHFNV